MIIFATQFSYNEIKNPLFLYNAYGTLVPTGLPLCSSKGNFMKEEIWKDIIGYERLYQISNLGNLKSYPRNGTIKNHRLLMPAISRDGYFMYCLSKNNIHKSKPAHRLVAQAFIPNNESKPQVNHINGIKTDNRVENLEWVTASENTRHAYKLGLINNIKGENVYNSKLSHDDIHAIFFLKKLSITNKKIALMLNYSQSGIGKILKGKIWKSVTENYFGK